MRSVRESVGLTPVVCAYPFHAGWQHDDNLGSTELGGAQVIVVLPSGVKWVGADHRREAYGLAY